MPPNLLAGKEFSPARFQNIDPVLDTFATLLFFDPKSPLDVLIVIQEMVNL
jgi:hypothetical protein